MKVVEKPISSLRFADYNPRTMTKAQEQSLTESLKKFNFAEPIVVNMHPKRKNIIIGGHQRVIVAKKLKMKTVPCVELSVPPEDERELNIRLNKNNGQFDLKKLESQFDIEDLLKWGFEKKELEFNVAELVDKSSKKKKAVRTNVEVMFQLGDIRFPLPQSLYVKWVDALAKKVGMKKEEQVGEIKKRLHIPVKVK